ncbi:MAG: enoyl-CoA hydratase/isomerase family protein [Methyloligellaceae bacterium]
MGAQEVLFSKAGAAGVITLNRPDALNAVTLGMVREMHPQLRDWAEDADVRHVLIEAAGGKAFSAGGDIRALYDWGLAGDETFLAFYREEYQLDTFIKRYPKPYVALLDGITMGGGVGVSIHGSHRIAGDGLTFAMPETGIGLFPDVGGTYFLPRCPGEIGMYLALSGARLKAADAVFTGIASHYVPSDRFAGLKDALQSSEDVDATISGFAEDPGPPRLLEHREAIDRCFAGDTVEDILARLENDGSEWAQKTVGILQSKSPTSLKITFRQIREGARLDFEDCMRLEFRMVNRIFTAQDFFEGTRAVVIDKDQSPKWSPDSLTAVTDDIVDGYFAPLSQELELPAP